MSDIKGIEKIKLKLKVIEMMENPNFIAFRQELSNIYKSLKGKDLSDKIKEEE